LSPLTSQKQTNKQTESQTHSTRPIIKKGNAFYQRLVILRPIQCCVVSIFLYLNNENLKTYKLAPSVYV